MGALWRIELLGGLRAVHEERVIARFRTQKTGLLLAYLALYREQAHSKEALVELFWPEADPVSGGQSLSMALSSLRRQLEPPGVPKGAVLISRRSVAGVNPDAVSTDVAEFGAALAAGRAAGDSERVACLEAAAEVYRGPLLPGCYEDWVLWERERLAGLFLNALGELARLAEQSGDSARALLYARRMVDADPLREESHRELIRLYGASGQIPEALRQYDELERLLGEELDATPDERTRALLEEIRRGAGPAVGTAAGERATGDPEQTAPAAAPTPAPGPRPPAPLRAGTLTFLLAGGDLAAPARERLRERICRHAARELQVPGDCPAFVFGNAREAVACALALQRSMGDAPVRLALHTEDVEAAAGDGAVTVPRKAVRLLSAAHPGQLLCSEATRVLLRQSAVAGVSITDLGLYRLEPLPWQPAERLFQVEPADQPHREFPAPAADRGGSGNLPLQFTRFFGREGEIERLVTLLMGSGTDSPPSPAAEREPTVRLLTLTGAAGCGKTRLAIEAARHLVERSGVSAWFVPLADLRDPALIPTAILQALRLSPAPGVEPLAQAAHALAHAPALLLLDNFEHLLEPGAVTVVQKLLAQAPALQCVVTSRRRLDLAAEREFQVVPLPVPGAAERSDLERAVRCASVQLFVDRAQSVQPDFQVTRANAAPVAALCRRLEGLPLALELAASRAQVLSPAQILAGLQERLDLLSTRRQDMPERHRTLQAAFDWSFQLLSPELRRVFAWLSVFRGGWTLEAAAAIVEGGVRTEAGVDPQALLDALERLRECSLVTTELRESTVRFRILETLAECAQGRLHPNELLILQRRHAEHFLRFALDRIGKLWSREEPAALGQLEAELENLRAAADWATRAGEARLGAELALVLGRFMQRRGCQREAVERVTQGLRLGELVPEEPPALRAELLRERANLHLDQFEAAEARRCAGEALALSRRLADLPGEAHSHNLLGVAALRERRYAEARASFNVALDQFGDAGQRVGCASVRNNLGILESEDPDGSRETAARHWSLALGLFRELDFARGVAEALTNLGALAQEGNDTDQAQRFYAEALRVERELEYGFGVARALSNLGETASLKGEFERACRLFAAAQSLFEQSGSPYRQYAGRLLDETRARLGGRAPRVPPVALRGLPLDTLAEWALAV